MREMIIGGLLITFPGLIVLAFAVFAQNFWMFLAVLVSVVFTALPFAAAVALIRVQHKRSGRHEQPSH